MQALKPCPFCGGSNTHNGMGGVCCEDCAMSAIFTGVFKVHANTFQLDEKVAEAWNRRTKEVTI